MKARDRNAPASEPVLAPLPAHYAFVVQFSRDSNPAQGRFAGQIEHLASGRQGRFSSRQEMLAFLDRTLAQSMAAPSSSDNPLKTRNSSRTC